MRLVGMRVCSLRMLLRTRGVLLALGMVALAMMFGGGTMCLGGMFVMLGGLVMVMLDACVVAHISSPGGNVKTRGRFTQRP